MRIAIHQDLDVFNHSTSWTKTWIEYCVKNGLEFDIVNCFSNDIIEILRNFHVLLWHFSHYSLQEMLFARSILTSAKNMGIRVFPDFDTSWHFDDKIAQTYLLRSVNAPIPRSWTFFTFGAASRFVREECGFPVVAKLRCGSGSSNVKLLRSKNQAYRYVKRMFGKGHDAAPSIIFKTKSNVQSCKDWNHFVQRFKRIPDFVETLRNTKRLPPERGYVFLQEYVPNEGYDLKVVTVGDKLTFVARDVRKGDFRASGGGAIRYDKDLITAEVRNIAFELSERLGFQCMGYDFIIDQRDQKGKIVEISYGFSHTAQMELGGYWDRKGTWYSEPLNAPEEILRNIASDLY